MSRSEVALAPDASYIPLGPLLISLGRQMQHRRLEQNLSLHDRLAALAKVAREQAAALPPGPERDALLKKARQADTASHLDDWANSPGLQPPK